MWKEWANTPRKKIVVQIINALKLSYRWESFDKAISNLDIWLSDPSKCPESIKQAADIGQRFNWVVKDIRKDFR